MLELSKFKEYEMDSVSPSFCGAKWLEGTIWLNSGMTASCHHTPAHQIDKNKIKDNPSAIHNTGHKKMVREMMLRGEKHEDCRYCWNIEELDHISDRVIKTSGYSAEKLEQVKSQPAQSDIIPEFLEIAFDRNCQFACMYCSPSYSTKWAQDINQNGPYRNLTTDDEKHYESNHSSAYTSAKNENPYIKAFWEWWPSLKLELKVLRITGGEPFQSPDFWKLLDLLNKESLPLKLAINTNLGFETSLLNKFIEQTTNLRLDLYTSGESFGEHAEYIRDGKDWNLWLQNIEVVCLQENIDNVCISFTVNSLSIFSMIELMDHILKLKSIYGSEKVIFGLNTINKPNFQSALSLPRRMRQEVGLAIKRWLNQNRSSLTDTEQANCSRVAAYLSKKQGFFNDFFGDKNSRKDLRNFIIQYDLRRNKDHKKVFPRKLVKWINA